MIEIQQHAADVDTVLETLADERRRHVLRCLCDGNAPITFADLADEVAARDREHETGVEAISGEERERIHLSLYHVHVPKLVDAGLVTCEQDRNRVDTVAAVDVESLLENYPF